MEKQANDRGESSVNGTLDGHGGKSFRILIRFTLLELVIVVAVIAILMSFLLPALQKAKGTALQIRCMNNLGQCGKAALMYASDYDGLFQIGHANLDWTGEVTWIQFLYNNNYLRKGECFLCPNEKPNKPPYIFSSGGGCAYAYQSYGINAMAKAAAPDNTGIYVCPSTTSYENILRLYNVKQPTNFLLFADSYRLSDDAQGYTLSPWQAKLHLRHGSGEAGKANAQFVDGHVEASGIERLKECGWNDAYTKGHVAINF